MFYITSYHYKPSKPLAIVGGRGDTNNGAGLYTSILQRTNESIGSTDSSHRQSGVAIPGYYLVCNSFLIDDTSPTYTGQAGIFNIRMPAYNYNFAHSSLSLFSLCLFGI